jgi:hypothetical protein
MSRMIDLIRESAVPASLMRTAARGALSLPPVEMLEILVLLAPHPIFGEEAQLRLAGWDEAEVLAVVSDAQSPPAIIDYFTAFANLRPNLAPALLKNPAVSCARLAEWGQSASRDLLTLMLASGRILDDSRVLRALIAHPKLEEHERAQIQARLEHLSGLISDAPGQDVLEPELTEYLLKHAAEITSEEGKPFTLVDPTEEEQMEIAAALGRAHPATATSVAARALGQTAKKERERLSPVQKIAKLSVGERVQLAYRGTRDERFILIRDGARIVSAAVLESPKVNESEAEAYASMRNVGEHVLRIISMKRKFMRRYPIKRLLVANPRTPTMVAMPLVKQLLLADLRRLMMNKDISDTVRHFAFKVYKDKSAARR